MALQGFIVFPWTICAYAKVSIHYGPCQPEPVSQQAINNRFDASPSVNYSRNCGKTTRRHAVIQSVSHLSVYLSIEVLHNYPPIHLTICLSGYHLLLMPPNTTFTPRSRTISFVVEVQISPDFLSNCTAATESTRLREERSRVSSYAVVHTAMALPVKNICLWVTSLVWRHRANYHSGSKRASEGQREHLRL